MHTEIYIYVEVPHTLQSYHTTLLLLKLKDVVVVVMDWEEMISTVSGKVVTRV